MEILKGQVRDPGYPDCECTYAKMDNGQLYYFIKDGELSNQNIIVTTILKEAIGHTPYTSLGLINSNGDVLIPFENKAITKLDDNLLLVEKNTPTTQSVVDAINAKSDPFAATNLVNTANAIKEQMKSVMGYSAEFVFDNQFSEAALYNIQGQNIGGSYFSFIGRDDFGNYYMTNNVLNSQIVKYDPSLVQNQVPPSQPPSPQIPNETAVLDGNQQQVSDMNQNNPISNNFQNDSEATSNNQDSLENQSQQSEQGFEMPNIDIPIQNQLYNNQDQTSDESNVGQESEVGGSNGNVDGSEVSIPSVFNDSNNFGISQENNFFGSNIGNDSTGENVTSDSNHFNDENKPVVEVTDNTGVETPDVDKSEDGNGYESEETSSTVEGSSADKNETDDESDSDPEEVDNTEEESSIDSNESDDEDDSNPEEVDNTEEESSTDNNETDDEDDSEPEEVDNTEEESSADNNETDDESDSDPEEVDNTEEESSADNNESDDEDDSELEEVDNTEEESSADNNETDDESDSDPEEVDNTEKESSADDNGTDDESDSDPEDADSTEEESSADNNETDDESDSRSEETDSMDVANEDITNPVIFNATNTIRKLLEENRSQREVIDHQADELENIKSSNEILIADNHSKEQELRAIRKSMSRFRGQNSSLTRENTKLKSVNVRQKEVIENLKHQNQVLKEQVAGISALGSAVAEANTVIGIDDNSSDDSITYDTDLGYLGDSDEVEDK